MEDTADGIILHLHIQAGASRDEICGLHGQRLKIRLKATAVNGKANQALLRLLAQHFAIPVSKVSLLSGEHSRIKKIMIKHPASIPDTFIM